MLDKRMRVNAKMQANDTKGRPASQTVQPGGWLEGLPGAAGEDIWFQEVEQRQVELGGCETLNCLSSAGQAECGGPRPWIWQRHPVPCSVRLRVEMKEDGLGCMCEGEAIIMLVMLVLQTLKVRGLEML